MAGNTITIPADELKSIVRRLDPAVSKRSTLPVLGGVRVTIDGDAYRFDVTDLELSVSIGSANGSGSSFVIPFKEFKALASKIPRGTHVVLGGSDEDSTARVGGAKLRTMPVEDFPWISHPTPGLVWSLPAQEFLEAFMSVARAASDDEARPILTGVRFELDSIGLFMIATDSYRMHWSGVKLLGPASEAMVSFQVPARAAKALSKLIGRKSERIDVIVASDDPSQVSFVVDDGPCLTSRLIEGEFPNWRQLIPTESPNVIVFEPDEFLSALASVSALIEKDGWVRLKRNDDGGLTFVAASQDVGEASEPVAHSRWTAGGEAEDFAFNAVYLKQAVEHGSGPLRYRTGLKPAIIGSHPGQGGYGALIMPVRL